MPRRRFGARLVAPRVQKAGGLDLGGRLQKTGERLGRTLETGQRTLIHVPVTFVSVTCCYELPAASAPISVPTFRRCSNASPQTPNPIGSPLRRRLIADQHSRLRSRYLRAQLLQQEGTGVWRLRVL